MYEAEVSEMSKFKKKVIWFFSIVMSTLLLSVQFSLPVFAIPSNYSIGVPIVTQSLSNWCWAACGASTVNYYGGSITQANYCYTTIGSYSNTVVPMSTMAGGLTSYGLNNHVVSGHLSYQGIQSESYTFHRPIVAGCVYYSGIGHIVLVQGYRTNSFGVDQVICMDPAYNSYQYIDYSAFVSNLSYFWAESIDSIY
jgi:hypothetical protein